MHASYTIRRINTRRARVKIHGMSGHAPRLPAGYRLDESQPGVFALRHRDGTLVAAFPSREALNAYLRRLAEDSERKRPASEQT